jgi:hypothetical protein
MGFDKYPSMPAAKQRSWSVFMACAVKVRQTGGRSLLRVMITGERQKKTIKVDSIVGARQTSGRFVMLKRAPGREMEAELEYRKALHLNPQIEHAKRESPNGPANQLCLLERRILKASHPRLHLLDLQD